MAHLLALGLDRGGRALYLQISAGIAGDIERGRLRPGDRLPSSRALANQLAVHRKTVVAAYAELERQGWIERRARSGVFVSTEVPAVERVRRASRPAAAPGFDWARWALPRRPTSHRARYDLLGGVPELAAAPTAALARAYRRALALDRRHRLIDYGDPRGDLRLREVLVEWLATTRGIRTTTDGVLVVRGAQHGMYLAARALLVPGDRVAVEAYTHPAVSSLLRLVGAEVVPVPVDAEGMRVDELERLGKDGRIRAVYTTPHHQLPTTVTLTAGRRLRLLALARRERILVLEDDYDHEFRYEGQPVLPLAYLDRHGVVVHFGTLSKAVAPGLRIAFAVAPPQVIERLAAYRAFVDHQGDQVVERAIAELLDDGELDRHLRRMLRLYRARRDALADALATELPSCEFRRPHGGMAIWLHAPGVDVDGWARRAFAMGVSFQPASHFACGDVPLDHARLGFAACREPELREAVRCMARALSRRR